MRAEVDQPLPPWEVEAVPVEAMKVLALVLRDPNPIHFDVDAVRRLGMGDRVVNQGPASVAYIANMLAAWCGDTSAIRRLRTRFLANVLAGDHVVAGGRVAEVTEVEGGTLARCEVWLERDDGTRVITGEADVLLRGARGVGS